MLSKVDLCFRMLKLSQAWVIQSGRLVGFITREHLAGRCKHKTHKPASSACAALSDSGLCVVVGQSLSASASVDPRIDAGSSQGRAWTSSAAGPCGNTGTR